MTTTISSFVRETQLTASATTLFNTSTSEIKFIGKFTLTNTSDNNAEATIWLLNSSTSETTGSGGNWAIRRTVPAGETITINELQGQVLNKSMKVSGLAATASVINVNISGTVQT